MRYSCNNVEKIEYNRKKLAATKKTPLEELKKSDFFKKSDFSLL